MTAFPADSTGRRTQRQISDRAIQWIFITPTLVLLILLNIFPLFYSLYLSFTDYSAITQDRAGVGGLCQLWAAAQ